MKKLLALLLLLPTLCFAQAAQNFIGNVGTVPAAMPNAFTCGLAAQGASLAECAAASTTGQRYYITGIAVQTASATVGTFAIQQGTSTNCGSNTAAIFPSVNTSARWSAPINTQPTANIFFQPALKTNPNYALCVYGHAQTINIQIMGYTGP